MVRTKRWECLAAAAGLAVLMLGGPIWAATPTTQPADAGDARALLDEVRALRAEVNELKQQRTTPPASAPLATGATAPAPTPPAVAASPVAPTGPSDAATAEAVSVDASQHRSNYFLLGDVDGFMSGFSADRFTLQSTDGKFVLRPWLHLQARDVTNVRQDYKNNGLTDTENGFEMRRVRFGVDGNLFGPDLTYFFNWATVRANGTSNVTSGGRTVGTVSNNLGGAPLLEEAWVRYRLPSSDFYLKGGQIKDPVYHESIVSSRYQQATERSLTADLFFNGDTFAEGATVGYDPKTFVRAEAGVDHGIRSANTNFLDYTTTNAYDYGAVGRVEFKAFGRWQDYQMGAAGVTQPLLVAGLGGEYSERGHIGQTAAAADVMYADQTGLSLFGAFADRYTTSDFGAYTQSATGASIVTPGANFAGKATNEYSLVGEVGYLFGKHLEPFGRYEYIHLAGTPTGTVDYFQEITGGVNYYFYGHRAKLTGQGTYLPQGMPIDDTPGDVLASPAHHGEFVFVAQFQLLL